MPDRWLTLADAARTLGIHPSTLRRWADRGEVPVTTTVGGHRRFDREDLGRFLDLRRREMASDTAVQVWGEHAMARTRHDLAAAPSAPWRAGLSEAARAESRALGQRAMGLLLRYVSDGARPASLEPEIAALGRVYGVRARAEGLPVAQAMEAAGFFRDALFESALHPAGQPFAAPEQSVRLLRRLNRFVNLLQVAIAETYDAA